MSEAPQGSWLLAELRLLRLKPLLPLMLLLVIGFRAYLLLPTWGVAPVDGSCKLQDKQQSKPLEDHLYSGLMHLRFPPREHHRVARVTLTEGVESPAVLNNTCENRRFMEALIRVLSRPAYKIHVVAIDQSYSGGSCPDEAINDSFRNAMEAPGAPAIVVGQRSRSRSDSMKDADCLVATPTFDFNHLQNGKDESRMIAQRENVHFGLLRLNDNSLKIPLSWWIFPPGADVRDHPGAPARQDGLAFVAAKLTDPTLEYDGDLEKLQASNQHPFTDIVKDLPEWSAMDLLCYGEGALASKHPEWGECVNIKHVPFQDLEGKTIVVGNHLDTDFKPFPGGSDQYGMDLHAQYIEALLNRTFLRTAPRWIDDGSIVLLGLFTIVLDLLSVRRETLTPVRIFQASFAAFLLLFAFAFYWLLWHHEVLLDFAFSAVAIVPVLLTSLITPMLKRHSDKNPIRKEPA